MIYKIIVLLEQKIVKKNIYLNIKSTGSIACPLLYNRFNNISDTNNYYEGLKHLIENCILVNDVKHNFYK